ncbi:hypothetical protein J6S88_06225 [bacterium]|nr:hypothetical protein [bacterium]
MAGQNLQGIVYPSGLQTTAGGHCGRSEPAGHSLPVRTADDCRRPL